MQLKIIEKYLLSLTLVIFLTGCTNALYFYETEKISLTVEARPDSSQPVQGNLGIKQRVVLIAPKKSENILNIAGEPLNKSENTNKDEETDINDSISAISSFSFNITPTDNWLDPVLIQTAFITGDAAADLNKSQAAAAAKAITVGNAHSSEADYSIMRNIVSILKKNDSKEDNVQLSLLGGLGKSIIPTVYSVPIFGLPTIDTIKKITSTGLPTNYSDIDSALSYWGQLDGSAQKLKSVLDAPEQYKYEGIPATNDMVKIGLQHEYEKTKQELKRISQELAENSIYANVIQYYIDKYIKNTSGN